MKQLSSFWYTLLVFPVLFFVCNVSGLFTQYDHAEIILIIYSVIFLFAGTTVRFFLYRYETSHKVIISAAEFLIGALLCAVPTLLSGEGRICIYIISLFMFFSGFRLMAVDYTKLINPYTVVISSVFYVLSAAIYAISQVEFSTFSFYGIYSIMIALYFVLNNQTNLDRLMENRGYDKKYLSGQTRSYNMKMILILCAVMFILITLKRPAGQALGFVFKILLSALLGLVRIIEHLIDPESPDDEIWERPLKIEEEEEEVYGTNYILKYISIAFMILTVIFLIVRFRKIIIWTFKHTAARLIKQIRTVFAPKDSKVSGRLGDAYTDQFETITQLQKSVDIQSARKQLTKWKKDYKNISAIKDCTSRYHSGYKLASQAISLLGYKISSSDTPHEIINKYDTRKYTQAAGLYDQIRYNDYKCSDNELMNLMSLLNDLSCELHEHKKDIINSNKLK